MRCMTQKTLRGYLRLPASAGNPQQLKNMQKSTWIISPHKDEHFKQIFETTSQNQEVCHFFHAFFPSQNIHSSEALRFDTPGRIF